MTKAYAIGDWSFDPSSHELRRGDEVVRLEHRAARALELLCERRGQVVPQAELAALLWGQRQVSGNSLAVVIGDLRRARGDDARRSRYVETVAKAGYRLSAPESRAESGVRRETSLAVASAVAALALAAGAAAVGSARVQPVTWVVLSAATPNETGIAAYDATARASGALLESKLSDRPHLKVWRAGEGPPPLARPGVRVVRLSAKLVIWTGQPDIALSAQAADSPAVIWSGHAFGPEPTLPRKLDEQLARFEAALAKGAT